MKDIVITAGRIRRECNFYLLSFVVAFLSNVYAVVHFGRPWIELLSQIGYVVVISVVVYFALWIPRLAVMGLRRLFRGGR